MSSTFSEHGIDEFLNHDYADHLPTVGKMFSATDDVVLSTESFTPDLDVHYRYSDNLSKFSRCTGMTGTHIWSQNLNPKDSNDMMIMNSQSSICATRPTSDTNPKQGDNNEVMETNGNDYEQSDDDDDTEIEAGQCEQSNDQIDDKKHKRMVSNRESAARSRKRKQAHVTDLEKQVDSLRVEYTDLFKQLTNASHQFKDASTNNRVLKSEVEALRAKVKLAEDMLDRGSMTSSLNYLLMNHLTTPQMYNCQNMSRIDNVSPTVTLHGDHHGPHIDLPVLGANPDIFNGFVSNGVNTDGGSCVSNIWSV